MTSTTVAGQVQAIPLPTASSTAPAPHNKKRRVLLPLAIVVAIGAIWYGAHWWNQGRFLEETDDAYVGGDITVITAKVPGYIQQVLVSDNQVVHAGDVLARLDDRDYRAALDYADGAVAAAQALLANLEASRALQQAVIAQARAGVGASRAETSRARDDQLRYQNLAAKAAVSLQSSQKADAEYKQALAGDQKTQAQLLAAERELDVIGTRKQQAEAALAQAVAGRDTARLNLDYTVLRAPIDGSIGNRRARNGAYASAGSQLLSLVPARGLWVDANFKESQLAGMRPGQPVRISADVLPGHVFHGTLASLAPATGAQFSVLPPENATGNFTKIVQRVPVRIALDARDATLGTLRPGLSVNAEIDVRPAAASTAAVPK
ncbi:HlyD family secretion protein [Janthinobacterium agaricidamnosum]|uniref:HlyD secretion family protein n=1 Tax=Janthinobacterium agaricidamnosum NBRC 102515 = DSM 9628 TaxID=1349767 RepID=W0VA87_9BURK|nr:HlyD family secretion protein [Janthinobacterium agaricidamnosum]CDG84187.1 hlyD secretion family protein [Janthinobacterium agaricidamnosum NBRC 102515 = DSM 9628]